MTYLLEFENCEGSIATFNETDYKIRLSELVDEEIGFKPSVGDIELTNEGSGVGYSAYQFSWKRDSADFYGMHSFTNFLITICYLFL